MANALQHGTSHEVIAANIEALLADGMDAKEARGAAYREAAREAMDFNDTTAREFDRNDYMLIKDNPIIRAGVFPYPGRVLPGADPTRNYNVYRPIEELQKAETLASFAGLPIIDEHEMLGGKYARGAEERGVHGAILENLRIAGYDVLAPLRIFSRSLKRLIDSGKKGLSLGYNCRFEKIAGVFDGITYDYIQRDIRGNHLALVTQGRNGTAVLDEHDVLDHFDLALDTGEIKMADETKGDEKKADAKDEAGETTEKKEMTLAEVAAIVSEIVPVVAKINETLATLSVKKDDADMALDDDSKEKPGDTAEDGKDKAMDSATVQKLVADGISSFEKSATKKIMGEVTKRNALAAELTPHVGTFVFDHMDINDVANYGAEKLGLKVDAGTAPVAVRAYLDGLKKGGEGKITYAMDSATVAKPKAGGLLANRQAKGAPVVAA